ncbi:MAG: N-acetylmuramoyl-L-alanine amidase [Ignavibacteria bacterium]|nr:N-acetylmuramoyl-L-alanine amidase [Ignavibacteria bacterium]
MKFSVIIFLLTLYQFSFAQLYSFSVNLNGKPSNQMIRTYQSNVTYFALDDLLEIVQFPHRTNSETLQEEITINEGTLVVTAYNPFLFLKKKDGQSISYQMLQSTDYRYGKIFVPLKSFSDFLNKHTNLRIDFNEKANLINLNISKSNNPQSLQKPNEITDVSKIEEPIEKTQKTLEPSFATKQYDLFDYQVEEKVNGYIFRIKSRKTIQRLSKNLAGNYLYIRIPNATVDTEKFNSEIDNGIIGSIASIQNGNDSDIKLTLKDKIQSHEIVRDKRTNDILLLLHVAPNIMNNLKEERKKKALQKNKNNLLDVIVIDPGHGGKDPGAIGYRGTKEKDVNLGIALKLGKLIEKNHKDIKVIYTRDDDNFVELYRRGQIANENNGKLFISIHCNSTEERPGTSKGAEVYLLRPGRTEDAIRIAEKENSVIKLEEGYQERYKLLSDENFILTAMASTANVKHSEKFAELLSNKFEANLPLKNNGVKQAGFYVLVGAAMPSVLIETGYINHPEDELFLRSETGQQKIAEAIYRAILDYKNYYEKLATK